LGNYGFACSYIDARASTVLERLVEDKTILSKASQYMGKEDEL